jgi:NADPH:quinone reductase-like Zn-dependent oxidoreductase
VAGTVEAVGAKVTGFRPGDEVYGGTWSGSFAELAVAKPSRLAPKPVRLSFEQAAAVPVSACTALQLLRVAGGVAPGQRVLVTGASGGVGSFAVQLAKAYGAEVTGTASPSKVDLVAGLGADHVIDYTHGSVADHAPYDLIVDMTGIVPLPELRRALSPEGTLVLGGGEGGGRVFGAVGRLLSAKLSPRRPRARSLTAFVRARDLETLRGLIDEGKVTPALERVYPFEEAQAALRHLDEGRVRGKIAIAAPRS